MPRVPPTESPPKDDDAELRRVDGQRASIAQLLLVARLRARTRRDLAVDSLERAAHVMFVTCKNWFAASPDLDKPLPPPSIDAPITPPSDQNDHKLDSHKGPDAHRHD